jgi:hypothetical protein
VGLLIASVIRNTSNIKVIRGIMAYTFRLSVAEKEFAGQTLIQLRAKKH